MFIPGKEIQCDTCMNLRKSPLGRWYCYVKQAYSFEKPDKECNQYKIKNTSEVKSPVISGRRRSKLW